MATTQGQLTAIRTPSLNRELVKAILKRASTTNRLHGKNNDCSSPTLGWETSKDLIATFVFSGGVLQQSFNVVLQNSNSC